MSGEKRGLTGAEFDAWVTALRAHPERQRRWSIGTPAGKRCAVGMLAYDVLGAKDREAALRASTDRLRGTALTRVVDLNDDDGLSFPQIADWLVDRRHEYVTDTPVDGPECPTCRVPRRITEESDETIGHEEKARDVHVVRLECGHSFERPVTR